MIPETRLDLPKQVREAPVSAVDAEARTIEAVWTTGATVRRVRYRGWDEAIPYDETLVVSDEAIDLTRLANGGPILDSHSAWSTRSQVGVVEKVWLEDGKGLVRIRFPSPGIDEAADRMFGLVSERIIRNLSVGYWIDEIEKTEPQTRGDVEQWRVVRWRPFEISFVTVPADAGAQTRGGVVRDDRLYPAIVTRSGSAPQETHTMDKETRTEPVAAPTETQPAVTPPVSTDTRAAPAVEAVAAERRRVKEVRSLCAPFDLPPEMVERFIDDGVGLEATRAAVIAHLAETSAARRIVGGGASAGLTVTDPGTSPVEVRQAMSEALFRNLPGADAATVEAKRGDTKPSQRVGDLAAKYRGMTMVEMAREYHQMRGRMSNAQVYDEVVTRAALGSSDFPLLLAAAANKFLLQQYTYQEQNYRKIAQRFQFRDFKEHKILRVGDLDRLAIVPENGEVHQGRGPSEKQNTLYAKTYGVIHKLTRQMFVNDDLNAFADLASAAGRGAAEDENYFAWNVILAGSGAGPTLADGYAVFNAANHKNTVTTGTAITIADVGAGRKLLRNQKSVDGRPLSGNVPTIIVGGPAVEVQIDQLLSTNMLATQLTAINPDNNRRLQAVTDAYITDTSWYLFADPMWRPVFRWGYVDGFEGPRFVLDQPFTMDGLALKVMLDFGFGAVDHVGAFRNPGA